MNIVRTWAFMVAFFGGSVPIVLMAPVMALFGTGPLRFWVVLWTRYHRWCARWVMGVRVVTSGTIPTTPALYVGKHQAMFETFEMVALLDAPVVVLKKELASIPVWGWAAQRYGMIVVDREGSSAALRAMMRAGQAAAATGRSVVIFPEGTRVAPGEQPELKPGFVGLYRALKLPLVPVAIDSGTVWPKTGTKRSGVIRFAFQEVIPPGVGREEVVARVHAAINVLDVPAA
ncbi:lysophospholipid acyltransferase family protein [Sphingomonas sp. PB4P5]|uniref:lysophospholipid acyltransferase family protein n=1 Tax=Parasphingomonas puruogangriensis TaxID=3096155 RepID=UPI002FC65E11